MEKPGQLKHIYIDISFPVFFFVVIYYRWFHGKKSDPFFYDLRFQRMVEAGDFFMARPLEVSKAAATWRLMMDHDTWISTRKGTPHDLDKHIWISIYHTPGYVSLSTPPI